MATDIGPIGEAREHARAAASDEYRRLLYVAMTRTAEHLIVCGAQGLNGKPRSCWYDLVCEALWQEAVEGPADHGSGAVRRWYKTPTAARVVSPAAAADAAIEIPAWLTRAAQYASDDQPRQETSWRILTRGSDRLARRCRSSARD